MNTLRIFAWTSCAVLLGACGSIKSSTIRGLPVNPPANYVLEELDAGERPHFSAIVSKGSVDSIQNLWLDLRLTPGQEMRVEWNDMNCNQISSQRRACSYALQGAVQAGTTVTGTWNARFRNGSPDTDATSVTLPGNAAGHDLKWNLVFLVDVAAAPPVAVSPTGGVLVLGAGRDYALSAVIGNEAGPVLPLVAEMRLEFADPSMADIVVPVASSSGLPAGGTYNTGFLFSAPAVTTSVNGVITAYFPGSYGDIDSANDTYSAAVRVDP